MFMTNERIDIVDYISASTPAFVKFIFKAPPLSYETNIFILPFSRAVWHCCFILITVVIICILLIVIWEWKNKEFQKQFVDKQKLALRPNFFDVVMMEIGAVTQQGSDKELRSYSGRIVTIFTFATLMFLYTTYSANIVALLQSSSNGINTLDDLLYSRIELGLEDVVYSRYYFEVSN